MKYRIVAKRVWNHFGRLNLRYFPQVYTRRWYWPFNSWTKICDRDDGYHNEEMAETVCKEHNVTGVRKEFEL
jgi:hypothetical protein